MTGHSTVAAALTWKGTLLMPLILIVISCLGVGFVGPFRMSRVAAAALFVLLIGMTMAALAAPTPTAPHAGMIYRSISDANGTTIGAIGEIGPNEYQRFS
jgi:hypothetical protein